MFAKIFSMIFYGSGRNIQIFAEYLHYNAEPLMGFFINSSHLKGKPVLCTLLEEGRPLLGKGWMLLDIAQCLKILQHIGGWRKNL